MCPEIRCPFVISVQVPRSPCCLSWRGTDRPRCARRLDPTPLRSGPFPRSGSRPKPRLAVGVAARTTRAVPRDGLEYILPPPGRREWRSVASASAAWDGSHVNRSLRKRKGRLENRQREGRQLLERSQYGGTADISSAYQSTEMAESATSLGKGPNIAATRCRSRGCSPR